MDLTLSMLMGSITDAKYKPISYKMFNKPYEGYMINYPSVSTAWMLVCMECGSKTLYAQRAIMAKYNILICSAPNVNFGTVGGLTTNTIEQLVEKIKLAYIEQVYFIEKFIRNDSLVNMNPGPGDPFYIVYRQGSDSREFAEYGDLLSMRAICNDIMFRAIMTEALGVISVNPLDMSKLSQ